MAEDAVNQIERLLNNFGAELTTQKVILQVMISHALLMQPDHMETNLEILKTQVLDALPKTPSYSTNSPEDERRVRNLSTSHAENFFLLLSEVVLKMKSTRVQSHH
jgi:hypothetical protein